MASIFFRKFEDFTQRTEISPQSPENAEKSPRIVSLCDLRLSVVKAGFEKGDLAE
jgi:hypothetical protein